MKNNKIIETSCDLGRSMLQGTKFFLGNGYMGYRGTIEEYTKKELTACTLAGVYDQIAPDKWREPVNAPNALYSKLSFEGEPMNVIDRTPLFHHIILDLYDAAFRRSSDFEKIAINTERFLSAADIHVICMRYAVTARASGKAELVTGIDCDIWDINGPHLPNVLLGEKDGAIFAEGKTYELSLSVAVAEKLSADFPYTESIKAADRKNLRTITFDVEAGETYYFNKYVAVYTSLDGENPLDHALSSVFASEKAGYDALFDAHKAVWAARYDNADVFIDGDDEAETALRYNTYIMYSNIPTHTDKVAIPARGLSGQVYKGAMFWDTEVYMMPLFNYTAPELSVNLAKYRVNTLEKAKEKAAEYGKVGAFYAWESQETGEDACTDFAVIDIFTGRPLRTHFRDQQIHISGDVAYGIWEYYIATGDESILLDGGAEAILECARFFYSWAYFKKDKNRYELLEVTCADEYHERVHNNFYTNIMAKYTLEMAVKIIDFLKEKHPDFYKSLMEKLGYEKDLADIIEMAELLYLPAPDENGIILQFDGYDKLECPTVAELKSRILDPREHLGAPVGLMTETQIIKQADVVLGLLLFSDRYSIDVRRANWEFYEPRCEHGSTLSTAIYAVLAAQIGMTDWAYKFFMKTANIDLSGNYRLWVGDLFIGGTHTAACGGTWLAAVQGFGGFKFDGEKIILNYNLPEHWNSLCFKVCCQGSRYEVKISGKSLSVKQLSGDITHKISVYDKIYELKEGKLDV